MDLTPYRHAAHRAVDWFTDYMAGQGYVPGKGESAVQVRA